MNSHLPAGWKLLPLGELGLFRAPGPVGNEADPIAYITLASVQELAVEMAELLPLQADGLLATRVEAGDLLLAPAEGTGTGAERLAVVPQWQRQTTFAAPEFQVFVPDRSRALPRWLLFCLHHVAAEAGFNDRTLVPVPPRYQQEWLVTILDHAHAIGRLQRQRDRQWRALVPAVFQRLCGQARDLWLTSPDCLDDVAELSDVVPSGPHHLQVRLPWLQDGDIRLGQTTAAGYALAADTLLVQVGPEGRLVTGRLRSPAFVDTPMVAVRSKDPTISTAFLWAWLRTAGDLLELPSPALTSRDLGWTPVPRLAPGLQQRIVQTVEQVEPTRTQAAIQAERQQALFKSLLHRCMSGKILPRPIRQPPVVKRYASRNTLRRQLSLEQQRIWDACRSLTERITVRSLSEQLRSSSAPLPSREQILATLDFYVTLGILIRDGGAFADRWRLARPGVDQEVKV